MIAKLSGLDNKDSWISQIKNQQILNDKLDKITKHLENKKALHSPSPNFECRASITENKNTITVKQPNKIVFFFSVPILPKLRSYDNVGRTITEWKI